MVGHDRFPRHMTASAFVLNGLRQVLLLRHRKLGVWLYPGGHVEQHETPDEAAVREVAEETGLTVRFLSERDGDLDEPAADVTALHPPYRILSELISSPSDPHYHIDLIYLVVPVGGDLLTTEDRGEIGFFALAEVESLELFPNFRRMLRGVFDDEAIWRLVQER